LTENESLIISIVDLHALTLPKEPKLLNDYIYKCAATLMSCGLDPAKTILYQQSQVNKIKLDFLFFSKLIIGGNLLIK
jgi:tryptophanyl-tRNA synthetase